VGPGPVGTVGKSRPHRDSIPDRPARSSVAIPTELPGPLFVVKYRKHSSKIIYYLLKLHIIFFHTGTETCIVLLYVQKYV